MTQSSTSSEISLKTVPKLQIKIHNYYSEKGMLFQGIGVEYLNATLDIENLTKFTL